MNRTCRMVRALALCGLLVAGQAAIVGAGPPPVPGVSAPAASDPVAAGLRLLHQGLYGAAAESFLELARRAPRDPEPQLLTAFAVWWRILLEDDESAATHSRFDTAIEHVLDLAEVRLEAEERDARTMTLAGSAYILRGHVEAGRKKYFQAARSARRGKKLLERALEIDPSQVDARFALGAYNYYADKVPAIVKGIRFILFLPGGDTDRGLEDLRLVARSEGLFRTDARLLLAIIEGSGEDRCYGSALALLRDALEENDGSPLIRSLIGELFMRLGYFERARREFEQAAAAVPGDTPERERLRRTLQVAIASALVSDWRLAEADALLRNGLIDSGTAPSAPLAEKIAGVRHELNLRRGMDAEGSAPSNDGRTDFDEALLLQEAGRYPEARRSLERYLTNAPDDIVARFVRARLLFHEDRDREAIAELSSLRRLDDTEPRWLRGWTELYLGMALGRTGDERGARSHYRKAGKIKRFESADRGFLELLRLDGGQGGCGV